MHTASAIVRHIWKALKLVFMRDKGHSGQEIRCTHFGVPLLMIVQSCGTVVAWRVAREWFAAL
jgi:hypothetical protein